MEVYLNEQLGKVTYEIDDTPTSSAVLILAHGAGAGMHHPFLNTLAKQICDEGVSVVRFNFPYMEKGRKAPGSPKDAILCWEKIILETKKLFHDKDLFISGKSYGGRMASHLLAVNHDLKVSGIIYYGFPLHAPGRDSTERAAHLGVIEVPQLFIQGNKDKLANIQLMRKVTTELQLASMIEMENGDHSFKTPKSFASQEETMRKLSKISIEWIKKNSD